MLKYDLLKLFDGYQITELRGKKFDTLIDSSTIGLWNYHVPQADYGNVIVRLVHVTEDLYIGDTSNYLSQLARVPFKTLEVTPYKCNEKGCLTGINIRSKQRKKGSRNIYLTIYDKFIESGGNEKYRGVLRCEQKISTFRDIRKKLEIKSNSLVDVLSSTCNPIQTLLNDIYKQIDNTTMKHTSLTGLEEQVYNSFFNEFKYNWSEILNHLKLTEQTPYHIRKVKAIYTKLVEDKNTLNYNELFRPLLSATTANNQNTEIK